MIICPKNKFIFVHIPKTAGTSLETVLQGFLDVESGIHITNGREDLENRQKLSLRPDQRLTKHSTARSIKRALGEQYDAYFSFAFVRNPYARTYSAFHFIQTKSRLSQRNTRVRAKMEKIGGPAIEHFANMTFEEFCHDWTKNVAGIGMFRSQITWLPKIDSVCFIGRVEKLREDFDRVLDNIGVLERDEIKIPVSNQKTKVGSWRSMPGSCVDVIQKCYSEDFERFGYSKDLQTLVES